MNMLIHFRPIDAIVFESALIENVTNIKAFTQTNDILDITNFSDFMFYKNENYIVQGNKTIAVSGTDIHSIEFYD